MKYKVVFEITSSGSRGSSVATFFKKSDAVAACQQWRELGTPFYAYLWDGASWTTYAPIP